MKRLFLAPLFLVSTLAAFAAEPQDAFTPLFDGTSLTHWEGDERFWRVEDGAIVGETTAENPASRNTFLIYRNGEFDDFELRFEYKVEGYNSGVQYRSEDKGDYLMSGLQADFEAQWHKAEGNPDGPRVDRFSGMFFEEKGRGFLGQRGDVVIVRPAAADGKKASVEHLASVGDAAELGAEIKAGEWNAYTVIAKGNVFIHIINERVMSIGIDEDQEQFSADGLIGFQLHGGPPMKIEVKNVRIREM